MDKVTKFQALVKAAVFHLEPIILRKYTSNYSPFSYGLIVGQIELFNLGMVAFLGKGKLWIKTC